MTKKIFYTALTVGWMILIYALSAKTADVSGGESTYITEIFLKFFLDNPRRELIDISEIIFRKLCHFGEYAVLSFFVYMMLRSFGFTAKRASLAILISALYAVTDEVHQYFVPGRACRIFDIAIDTLGASFAYLTVNIKRVFKIE